MRYFKDDKDGFYAVGGEGVFVPPNWVQITDDEAAVHIHTPADPTPIELLVKLDAENTLTQRNLREFILLTVEAIKMATNNAVDLSQVRGVSVVAAVEAQAAALRAQL